MAIFCHNNKKETWIRVNSVLWVYVFGSPGLGTDCSSAAPLSERIDENKMPRTGRADRFPPLDGDTRHAPGLPQPSLFRHMGRQQIRYHGGKLKCVAGAPVSHKICIVIIKIIGVVSKRPSVKTLILNVEIELHILMIAFARD
ncbi:hypothetical protein QTP88_014804 [Uroleucon formosanum]